MTQDNDNTACEHKPQSEEIETPPKPGVHFHADAAADLIGNQHFELTEQDNKRILRKTDKHILVVLVWVYFLQTLDKTVLGYGAVFGLRTDTNLVGNQYSLVSSIAPIAQLAWLPFSSYLLVRIPHRILASSLCLGWGIAQTCMAASTSYSGLLATRFFLGLFEAGCLPLFSVITAQWYRRAEQPLRIACWYSMNGIANMFAAAVSYGLAQIPHPALHSWQIQFLFVGLLTICSAPVVYMLLDNDIPSCRFLTEDEKLLALERLRANQTGTGNRDFKWKQVVETLLDIKTWLFVAMGLTLNVTAIVTNTFGPIVVAGFGFNSAITSLLNIPFGALQFAVIFPASYFAYRFRLKSPILIAVLVPVLAGTVMLYVLDRSYQPPLLAAYYMLSFLFGANSLIVSWMASNTAGATKKSITLSLFNIGVSAGNIIGPLLFNSVDAPRYLPGLSRVMIVTCTLMAVIGLQVGYLFFLNRMQERRRELNGKPRKLRDQSMMNTFNSGNDSEAAATNALGENAFLDLTDRQNDEFVYLY
ncbi:major facilitator superfamily domain-containing protein [Xylariales sp. PMI_506]|nr:major facilitator superfamily domain-containing protein [Xylariales sp. PMI_506]